MIAFSSAAAEPPVSLILARAGQTLGVTGERLLAERLHRVLDESGPAGLRSVSETLLPHLQALVALLPCLARDDTPPEVREAAQRLGTLLQQQGIPLQDIIVEWAHLHELLLQGLAAHLRANDRALVMALIQISRNVLEMGQHALLAYQESATATLRRLARSDSLTGLANRRYFDERFQEELLRAQRLQHTLAVILIDMDGLKPTNDTFGHAAGDHLLSVFATVLRAHARGIDLVARIGGDEFALLLPETDRAGAVVFLQRLTRGVGTHLVHDQPIRFSAGIAVYPADGTAVPDLMGNADRDLYRTKHQHRMDGGNSD